MSIFSIESKRIVITGGSGVLGKEAVNYLLENGAKVCVINRTPEKLKKLLTHWSEKGDVLGFSGDVLDEDFLLSVKKELKEKWGGIDVLINAAGGNKPGAVIQPDSSFFDASISDLREVFDLNLMGTLLPTYVLADLFPEGSNSSIINYSSMAADRAITRVLGYSMAKGSVDIFTKWLAVEFAKKYGEKIRVNAIAPGFFLTEQNERLLTNEDGSLTSRGETIIASTPYGRFGKPEELNGVVHYLSSDASRFVTGVIVPVDGGFSSFSGV